MKLFPSIVAAVVAVSSLAAQGRTDLEKGKQLFDAMCSRCHGLEGTGGEGPNLNRPTLSRAQDDASLIEIIRNGIPGGGMPAVLKYGSDNEVHQLVGYVRSLGRTTEVAVPGDVKTGKAIYERLGCSSCHIVSGEGRGFGPELTRIGEHRSPAYLRQAILQPETALPRGVLPIPGRGLDEFLPVHIVTQDGRELRGIRINEDSFTIQLKDAGDAFHSFRKADLKVLEKEPDKSLMPSYQSRLSAAEATDLVAYLYSLKGSK
jgi:putative heme-binding domain-containing protein